MIVALFINRDADHDWLVALEYGRVCDGHPPEQFRGVSDVCAFMLDRPLRAREQRPTHVLANSRSSRAVAGEAPERAD